MSTPGGRGTTIVSDRAFMKIAEQVAGEDEHVADRPHVSGTVAGSVAAIHLDLAVRYPTSVAGLAHELRERIRSRMRELTGITVENIDIEVVRLVPGQRRDDDHRRHPV
ncbi:Asp23/Gls24 family envelope stress response protein [Microbispora sp. RL4-1S]|uniref:Asp23/Gls24 family envelope stress response protein n=1 Tax=Microbispora oryzae TaxID=2806554 RepID=A0A941AM09_9ACTN|nr:Asp23/Gls24 family envelope stress response protein [Microbispora oryzae]MBP2707847.1 Asp23/Gls24 family envelope stress response protein [Microbispora oryzae]